MTVSLRLSIPYTDPQYTIVVTDRQTNRWQYHGNSRYRL